MTPLARFIFEQAFQNKGEIRQLAYDLYEAHFFDVTRIADYIQNYQSILTKSDFKYMLFTPAPLTWIECDTTKLKQFDLNAEFPINLATGILLTEIKTGPDTKVLAYLRYHKERSSAGIYLTGDEKPNFIYSFDNCGKLNRDMNDWDLFVLILLGMINRPREFGQLSHNMHKGFVKKISDSGIRAGKFPFRAYTEILLPVGLPEDKSSLSSRPTGLTWNNPLHFVRKHLRKGKEIESFWRGDPALGIKRSRYVLVNRIEPPRHLVEQIPEHLR